MMKTNNIILLGLLVLFSLTGCEDYLKETPPGELAPETFLATPEGVESVLFSAYVSYKWGYGHHEVLENVECPTDILYQTGGGMNKYATILMDFLWTSTTGELQGYWNQSYSCIRDANIVLDNIDNLTGVSDEEKAFAISEARYLRAVSYIRLYSLYGAVPLRKSAADDPELPRASEAELLSYIETELEECVAGLPDPGQEEYGRASKGAALGFLTRFYLNTKQWQKAADAAQRVMDLNYYELWPDYTTLFDVANERDKNPDQKEMIAVSTQTNVHPYGGKIMNCALPPNYLYAPKLERYTWNTGMRNWASNFRLRDAFVDSFDKENDLRFGLIIEEYVNRDMDTVNLRDQVDNSRCLKYFDPDAVIASHGNDIPFIRYAEILLARAEALNELNGPNQESLDLLNMVRTRAGLADMQVSDFAGTEAFRDHIILKERGWEFYNEFVTRRDDLIRHGSFISGAVARGKAAQGYHVLFPIPQGEIDGNKNITEEDQNPGY